MLVHMYTENTYVVSGKPPVNKLWQYRSSSGLYVQACLSASEDGATLLIEQKFCNSVLVL